MDVRRWLNENPKIAIGLLSAIVVIGVGSIVMQVLASRHGYPTQLPDSYFTVDDGKTFFVANSSNIPPFDYEGQIAVRAYVFKCDGKKFVGYVERYLPEARKSILAGKHTPEIERFGREMKKPGATKWLRSGPLEVENKMSDVRCPDGHGGVPEAIEP
jgi:hypothetical protein